MLKTYQYRLYPSKAQEKNLYQILRVARNWYNMCLAERKVMYEQNEQSVGKYEQLSQVKYYKRTFPQAKQVHSHVLQVATVDVHKAFEAFFRRVKAGETAGYPRFKSANRFMSFGFKQYGNGFKIDGRRLRIYGAGRIPVRWHRQIDGKIKTCRISCRAGKWYVSFTCEIEQPKPLPKTEQVVGIDVGISSLITTSDGEHVANPEFYRQSQVKLRRLQRTVSRRKKFGKNWRKAIREVQRQHEKVKNQRQDYLRKLAHGLIQQYDVIAVEELQITNMVCNKHLSKSILDSGWGYFVQHLMFKAEEAGREVILVDPRNTSKTCSQCGAVFEGLKLAHRWVKCACGLSLDRDHNAAINILKRAGHVRWDETWVVAPSVSQEATRIYSL